MRFKNNIFVEWVASVILSLHSNEQISHALDHECEQVQWCIHIVYTNVEIACCFVFNMEHACRRKFGKIMICASDQNCNLSDHSLFITSYSHTPHAFVSKLFIICKLFKLYIIHPYSEWWRLLPVFAITDKGEPNIHFSVRIKSVQWKLSPLTKLLM